MIGKNNLPLKSVAGALIFAAILGPVGLLYTSVWGGVVLMVLGFFFISAKFFVLALWVWLLSCVWTVVAANRYNKENMTR